MIIRDTPPFSEQGPFRGRQETFISLGKKGLNMTGQTEDREYHISKNRLETLVDGIFAFAMTLLVLGINPPRPEDSQATAVLPSMIESLIPEIFLFILAFLVLVQLRNGTDSVNDRLKYFSFLLG